jgi:hypothetical protein
MPILAARRHTVADKNRLIDAIREINPTAAVDWLARFTEVELRDYYERLMGLLDPSPGARWMRRGEAAAIFVREVV